MLWQDFTVEDFLCECASLTAATEAELRGELENIAREADAAENFGK